MNKNKYFKDLRLSVANASNTIPKSHENNNKELNFSSTGKT